MYPKFGPDFLWGASTSAYQIEGAHDVDGRKPSIWDSFCRLKGRVDNGDSGDIACNHYNLYKDDVALMRDLGLDAYRFSIAWPRIIPKGRGKINPKGLDFYDRLTDELLAQGITPWATLYHWDYPQALHDLGGWANRDSAGWFADYALVCAKHLGDRIKNWASFNEFSVFTLFGYAFGWGAPSISDKATHLQVIHNVNRAHGIGVDVLRSHVKDAHIGAIHNFQPLKPEKEGPGQEEACATFNEFWNICFPDAQLLGHYPPRIAELIDPYVKGGDMAQICRPIDWFGLNHYAPMYSQPCDNMLWGFVFGTLPDELQRTGVGWPIHAPTFKDTLLYLTQRYKLPIYVTENGYGTGKDDVINEKGEVDDPYRLAYMQDYIKAMNDALREGANVKGYFAWSVLDKFEWGAGLRDRFGIVYIDYETQKRIPKSSAKWYAGLIKEQKSLFAP